MIRRLDEGGSRQEQHRILQDLADLAEALLEDSAAFPDLPALQRTASKRGEEEVDDAPTLDLDQLVRPRDEVHAGALSAITPGGAALPSHLSLHGVMRYLFAHLAEDEAEDAPGPAQEPEQGGETGERTGPNDGAAEKVTDSGEMDGHNPFTPQQKKRLSEQMDGFLRRLRGQPFAESCTAYQLVQATAFPLVLAFLCRRRGWQAEEEEASVIDRWVVDVVILLFRKDYRSSAGRGLLAFVEFRYREAGRADLFLRTVGDGTLWVALLTAWAELSWSGPSGAYERARMARAIWRSRALVASSNPGRLEHLAARASRQWSRDRLLEEAHLAATALDRLEDAIQGKERQLYAKQESLEEIEHCPGDLLFRPSSGWGVV